MRSFNVSLGLMLTAGVMLTGCGGGQSSTAGPTTVPIVEGQGKPVGPATMAVPSASAVEVTLPAGPPPAAKDLTHVLTKDQPFFLGEPTGSDKPIGTLKSGSKVLVLIPGAEYSQVITDRGVSAYTPTDGLKPLGK